MNIPENVWRRFERERSRRERLNLIRSGVITPAYGMKPQMMVKNGDGSWSPEVKTYTSVGRQEKTHAPA